MFLMRFMALALFASALMPGGRCIAASDAAGGGVEADQTDDREPMPMPDMTPAMPIPDMTPAMPMPDMTPAKSMPDMTPATPMPDMTPAKSMPDMTPAMSMRGLYGAYSMSREASGTSWQPDSTPMQGLHRMGDPWTMMWHGMADLIYDDQGGPRGDTKTFSNSMLMFMGRREVQDGAAGVRVMISADPLLTGKDGYPELFQTGETADGVHPLIDRQHPHNLLMEAAATYSLNLSARSSVFAYAGIAGEPALGPPAFMHRFSGLDNPEAPLSHHWLDSTHITYGVATAGYVWDRVKLEASAFNGREPDQNRYDVELRRFDSYSARLSCNPLPDLALQVSYGRLASPEQLEPNVAVRRSTASASYNRMLAAVQWQTTVTFGRNAPQPGTASDAWLLESEFIFADVHTLFARAERVAKDELFLPGQQPYYGRTLTIDSLSLGYIYDFTHLAHARIGIGGLVAVYRYASILDSVYGDGPVSTMVFLRIKL
jgi:hypothetical protein